MQLQRIEETTEYFLDHFIIYQKLYKISLLAYRLISNYPHTLSSNLHYHDSIKLYARFSREYEADRLDPRAFYRHSTTEYRNATRFARSPEEIPEIA